MKPFTTLAVVLFSLLAVFQLTRFAMQWQVSVNGFELPLWPSAIVALFAAALAFLVWRENTTTHA